MVAIYFQWIPAVLFGYYACRYGWLAKVVMMDIKKSVIILFVLLIQRLIFPYFFMLDFLSVLLIATVAIKITPPPIAKNTLAWLGQLSMTIWFVHGVFFLYDAPFPQLIQWNSVTILLMGGLYSVLISYLINLIKSKF